MTLIDDILMRVVGDFAALSAVCLMIDIKESTKCECGIVWRNSELVQSVRHGCPARLERGALVEVPAILLIAGQCERIFLSRCQQRLPKSPQHVHLRMSGLTQGGQTKS